MSVVTKHDSFDASLSRLEVLKLVAFGVCMQPPPKALPPYSHYKQVAPAKALCLAVAFEAMSEQPGGFKRTMGADPAPAEDEQGGCLSPPDDTLYVPGSSSEEQGPPEAEQGGCLSPLAKPRVGGCPE